MMARFKCYLDSLFPHKKPLSEFGKNFLDPRIVMMCMLARGLYMKIDNLLIFYSISFVAVSARDLGILHGKNDVISGREDRLAI